MRSFFRAGVACAALLAQAGVGWGQQAGAGELAKPAPVKGSLAVQTAGVELATEQVTVTATRMKRRADEVPVSATVIDAEKIEEILATDIKDLVRFEPGVSVRNSPSRFTAAGSSTGRDGNSGFNIRGLEGNRVLIQVDGIRVPDAFSFGPQSVGRGDYVDLDVLQSVEIVRGPASALYGSDGLAGSVSFTTRDPEDFLREGEEYAARARVSYASADESWAESAIGAATMGDFSALIAYTRRDAHEQDNEGENDAPNTTRTAPNPQDIASDSILAKLLYAPGADNVFRLTFEYANREVETEVLSGRAAGPTLTATSVIDLDALDESTRNRVTFDHRFGSEGAIIDDGFWAVYYQTAETREFSAEDRYTAADRTRDSTFDNDVWGATAQLQSSLVTGEVGHTFVYGFDFSQTRQEGIRDGTTPPFGETFPTRPFPKTDYRLFGAYLQDEISFLDGKLSLFPAIRYDAYELSPEDDALYAGVIAEQSDDYVSPKFGVVYWPIEVLGFYANYAAGFKAPSPSQVNNGFTNLASGYTSVPNPDLAPETSNSYEAGIRWRGLEVAGAKWSGSIAGFTADYDDFIEQVQVSGSFTPSDPAVYQFVNLSEVEIYGFEVGFEGAWDSGFGFRAAASSTTGRQEADGVRTPLNSIDPWRIVSAISYNDPSGIFGGQLILTHSAGKQDSDVNQSSCSPSCYTPASFTILDATAYWTVTEDVTLRVGVFNITDEKYWWWSDVRGVSATSTVLDAYTQPGRNVSASLAFRF